MKFKFFILFILILVFTYSYCYAYTVDQFFDYAEQIYEDTNNNTVLRSLAYSVLNKETRIRSLLSSNASSATSFMVGAGTDSNAANGYFMILPNSSTNVNLTFGSTGVTMPTNLGRIIFESGSPNGRWSNGSANTTAPSTRAFGLVETNNNINSNYYFQNKYVEIPPYTGPIFTPTNNGFISVTANGITEQFNGLPFYPNGQNDWTLGYITDYDGVYAINGYFGPYIDYNIVDESMNQFNYNYYYGTYNGGICFDSSTGRVYVKKDRLLNKQGYALRLNYQLDLGSNNADDFYEGNFYAYYGTLSISSGDLFSSELPDYSEINAFINSFGDFWEPDNENLDYLANTTFPRSGDLYSGEFFGVTFIDYDNFGFGDFVYSFLSNFYNVLSSYDDVTINFGLLGDINSSIFTINNQTVALFIGTFTTIFFIIIFISFYYRLFKAISTMNLTALFNFDVDNLFGLF